MKIEAFRTLDALLRNGTVTAAARELSLTPSAVSMQIKQLESYLGQQLFDRSGQLLRALPLTYEVAGVLRGAIESIEAFRRQRSGAVEGVIRLGVIDTLQHVLLPQVFYWVRNHCPGLDLRIISGRSFQVLDALKAGEVDVAVVGQLSNRASTRVLDWRPLIKREFLLVAPPGTADLSIKMLFQKLEWIRFDRSVLMGRLAAKYVTKHIPKWQSSIELRGARTIVAMVSANLGLSVLALSDPSICQMYPVLIRQLRNAPTLQYFLVSRKADRTDRKVIALCDCLLEIADTSPDSA